MSILCHEPPHLNATCELCGNNWDDCDLYRCDYCQRIMCEDCKAAVHEDCPNEICVECVEDSK